ncbi:hypothetical protein F4825DRAFT_465227 [Nemania diffusa]|nr:hypothetical protein F4825DRAFT_465227 [Nemania diffusa]
MASLIRARPNDQGLLAVKPSSPRATSFGGHRQASGSGSQDMKAQGEVVATKPWADQPWPLIETPSRTQAITHPALHIANEIALIHNAMLRGLNAIYLQAPHVQKAPDVADFLFITQSWSTWLLDHHSLKEGIMLPGFEAVLGVPAGTLTLPQGRSKSAESSSSNPDEDITAALKRDNGKDKEVYRGEDDEEEEMISFLLHRVYAYASATHKDPQVYNADTLAGLLDALATALVPHLTKQVGLLMAMREMCLGAYAPPGPSANGDDVPGPLPIPMVTITRTVSNMRSPSGSPTASPPLSPSSSSTFSASSSASTSASSPGNPPPLSIVPNSSRAHPKTSSSSNETGTTVRPNHPGSQTMAAVDSEARDRLARARALLEAGDRAARLTKVYLAAEARATAAMDHFVVPPMIVRLRDATVALPPLPLSRTASASSLSSASSHGSRGHGAGAAGMGMGMGIGGGMGGGMNAGDWPRMSIPAVHAIADKLSPRHAGAWRFLPCDVWGRPRELPFAG